MLGGEESIHSSSSTRGNMLGARVLRAVIAGLLPRIATGLVAPRSGATQPMGANRLPFRRAHDDAAAAALDSFDDLASLERRLAALDDGVVPKLRGFFDTELKSFALEPGVTRNYSVTSSAICIGALLDADALGDDEAPVRLAHLAHGRLCCPALPLTRLGRGLRPARVT